MELITSDQYLEKFNIPKHIGVALKEKLKTVSGEKYKEEFLDKQYEHFTGVKRKSSEKLKVKKEEINTSNDKNRPEGLSLDFHKKNSKGKVK